MQDNESKTVMNTRPKTLRSFGAAIRRQRETLGLTLDVLAAKTGISKPYLSNIETGRAPGPPSEGKLALIAAALGWPERELVMAGDWLRTPKSVREALLAADSARAPRREDGTIDLDQLMGSGAEREAGAIVELPVRSVPVLNCVAAGKPAEFSDLDYPAGIAEEYVPVPDLPGVPVKSAFALRVSGDSMMPEYVEGELLIVGPGEARDGEDCVVRLGRGANFATTFKRVFFVGPGEAGGVGGGEGAGKIRLVALNPKYAERVVVAEEVTGIYPLLYRVVAVRGEGGGWDKVTR